MTTNDRDPFGLAGEQPATADPVEAAAARWRATIEPAGEDVELLRLIAEEQALTDMAVDHEDDGNEAEAERCHALADEFLPKVLATPARTIAGVIALLLPSLRRAGGPG